MAAEVEPHHGLSEQVRQVKDRRCFRSGCLTLQRHGHAVHHPERHCSERFKKSLIHAEVRELRSVWNAVRVGMGLAREGDAKVKNSQVFPRVLDRLGGLAFHDRFGGLRFDKLTRLPFRKRVRRQMRRRFTSAACSIRGFDLRAEFLPCDHSCAFHAGFVEQRRFGFGSGHDQFRERGHVDDFNLVFLQPFACAVSAF